MYKYIFIYIFLCSYRCEKKKGGEGGGRGQEGFFGIFPLSAYSRLLLSAWKECPSRLRERFVNKKFTHTHTQGEGVFSTIVFFFLMSVAKKKNKNLVIWLWQSLLKLLQSGLVKANITNHDTYKGGFSGKKERKKWKTESKEAIRNYPGLSAVSSYFRFSSLPPPLLVCVVLVCLFRKKITKKWKMKIGGNSSGNVCKIVAYVVKKKLFNIEK